MNRQRCQELQVNLKTSLNVIFVLRPKSSAKQAYLLETAHAKLWEIQQKVGFALTDAVTVLFIIRSKCTYPGVRVECVKQMKQKE